jgi:hypothetical protein
MVETGDELVEGMYQKMWKDFVSLQRGDAKQICVDAARWRYFAQSAQTALMLGSELDPHSKHDWLTECNKLADGLMTPNVQVQGASRALSRSSPGTQG